jgi:hypothetical protein
MECSAWAGDIASKEIMVAATSFFNMTDRVIVISEIWL